MRKQAQPELGLVEAPVACNESRDTPISDGSSKERCHPRGVTVRTFSTQAAVTVGPAGLNMVLVDLCARRNQLAAAIDHLSIQVRAGGNVPRRPHQG